MAQAVNGIFPVMLKVVFEIRYRQGYTYLDRCGRTINLIQEYHPDWILTGGGQPSAQGATMFNVETGSKFSFSSLKIDVGIDRPSRDGDLDEQKIQVLSREAEELTAIVIDQLGLAEFSRIGCRVWYLFPTQTAEDAMKFLESLNLFDVSSTLTSAFGGEREAASFAVTINGQDRKFRVGFETVERTIEVDLGDAVVNVPVQLLPSHERKKALIEQQKTASRRRKHPPFAAIIDVDAYREQPAFVKPGEFLLSSVEFAATGIGALAEKTKGK